MIRAVVHSRHQQTRRDCPFQQLPSVSPINLPARHTPQPPTIPTPHAPDNPQSCLPARRGALPLVANPLSRNRIPNPKSSRASAPPPPPSPTTTMTTKKIPTLQNQHLHPAVLPAVPQVQHPPSPDLQLPQHGRAEQEPRPPNPLQNHPPEPAAEGKPNRPQFQKLQKMKRRKMET